MNLSLSIPEEKFAKYVYLIRNQKVILDIDLAVLYSIPPINIKRAVKRYINKFTKDHMFSLSNAEMHKLKRKITLSSSGGMKYAPTAFTYDGVVTLINVLNSEKDQFV